MKSLLVPLVVLLAVTAGCRDREKAGPRAGTTTATGASWLASAGAVERIASSRCARESACGRVGPNGAFADDQSCLREMARRSSVELDARTCPTGVDPKKVERCEAEISHRSCAVEGEAPSACRAEELCLSASSPRGAKPPSSR